MPQRPVSTSGKGTQDAAEARAHPAASIGCACGPQGLYVRSGGFTHARPMCLRLGELGGSVKITETWYRCPRCHLPVVDTDLPMEDGEVFPEVVTTEVIVTAPYEGPQVDTEYPHNC